MPPPSTARTPRLAPSTPQPATATPANGSPAIRKAGIATSPRIILNAVEGFGKTTIGAYAPTPIFLQARGETGLETLRGVGRVPDVDTFEVIESWPRVLAAVEHVCTCYGGHKTIVIDALGGFERLCHEHICATQFNGDWGERGFSAYGRGPDASIAEWLKLLVALERLQKLHGVMVLITSHCKVRPFKNPMGPDFDRYTADAHDKTWGCTHKWADAVLFGNFYTVVREEKTGKPKGIGGSERVIYTERQDAFDSKNRYGMPNTIDIPNDPTQAWNTIAQFLPKGK